MTYLKNLKITLLNDFTKIQILQPDPQSGELLFIDLEKRKQEPSATKVADYNGLSDGSENENTWHSQSCVLGWAVLGIWPPGADGSDVNSTHRNGNRKYLATGDDFGKVKIFNYPCAKVSDFISLLSLHRTFPYFFFCLFLVFYFISFLFYFLFNVPWFTFSVHS